MRQLPAGITFERWVTYVFDHPILEPQWWFQALREEENDYWDERADGGRTLRFLTCFFSSPAFLKGQFTHAQIDQGLNFLVSNGCSNHMLTLTNSALPWQERRACIEAMHVLYRDLMAPLYGNDLAHARRAGGDPEHPNFSCYMWWDIIPLYGGMDHPDRDKINEAVLHVFEETLKLKAESCLESVLHGLGHWHMDVPDRTGPITRRFLLSRQDISCALRRYAEQAATGYVE